MEEKLPIGLRIKLAFDNILQNCIGYDKVWLYVKLSSIKTIKDLQKHVKRRFGLRGSHSTLKLFLQEFWLMPEESIAILQNEDLIVVRKANKSTEQYHPGMQHQPKKDLETVLTSRSDFEDLCAEQMKKNLSSHTSPSQSNDGVSFGQLLPLPITLTEITERGVKEKTKKKKRKKYKLMEKKEESEVSHETPVKQTRTCNFDSNLSYENIFVNDTSVPEVVNRGISDTSLQKRKRNRHRKRKSELSQPSELVETGYQNGSNKIVKSVSYVIPEPVALDMNSSSAKRRQHIRFDQEENELYGMAEPVDKSVKENFYSGADGLVSDNPLSASFPNGLHQVQQPSKNFEKNRFRRKPKNDHSSLSVENADSHKEGREDDLSSVQPANFQSTLKEKAASEVGVFTPKNFDACSNLEGPPRIGDKIAFKQLILSQNYSPEVSEYRVGIVRAYEPSSQNMEIELLEEVIIDKPNGKFEIDIEEDDKEETKIDKMKINLSSLVTPKLLV